MKCEARNTQVTPWRPTPAAARALAPRGGAAASDGSPTTAASLPRRLGPYPCPRGFALSVPMPQGETLVPMAADGISALAPLAGTLALVRAAGGFQTEAVAATGVESLLVFERVPCLEAASRRLFSVARELLAMGADALPARERLRFQPALEVRASGGQALCVQLYGEGPAATDERVLQLVTQAMLPVLTRLVESAPRISTRPVLRRWVRARCRIGLKELLAATPRQGCPRLPSARQAVSRALRELAAARSLPALARAQNDGLLGSVARVARALGDDDSRILEEGHRYAGRLGTVRPLAALELDGDSLLGALQLPSSMVVHPEGRGEGACPAPELPDLPAEHSADVSACVGLASHLARATGLVSLAMSGALGLTEPASRSLVSQRAARATHGAARADGGVQQSAAAVAASAPPVELCVHSILIGPRSGWSVSTLPAWR